MTVCCLAENYFGVLKSEDTGFMGKYFLGIAMGMVSGAGCQQISQDVILPGSV